MSQVHLIKHPLIQHKLSIMRMKSTTHKDFRELLSEIALLLGYETTRNLPLEEYEIETPLCKTTGYRIAGKKMAIVPILRAGLGFLEGLLNLIPAAKVGHIGMARDEKTHQAHTYYCKLPDDIANRFVIITDPMLATGGSAIDAVTLLKEHGCSNIRIMCLLAAPEGIARMQEIHPDVDIYTAAIDDHLDENAYIVPGLGDAGDRIFGTK